MKENLIEMDKKIKHYKDVLISLQNSYKIINEFDVDGHPIEEVELDFLNLRDVNVVKEKEIKSITHVITIESNNIKENATTKYDDDLDGEPI